MIRPSSPGRRSAVQQSLLIAGIILIALNLRPALAGVGPLVADIRVATGLSNTALGFLTTLPLLAFGVFSSTLTPLVARRRGLEATLAGAMLLIALGVGLRALPSVGLLFAGTLLLGTGIAFGNVLLPSLVKRDFPERSGVMTSLYSSVMGLGATLGAGLSVPLAMDAGLGWRGSLGAWSLLALAAFVVWLPQLKDRTLPRRNGSLRKALHDLGRSRLAWDVALFMGLQSLTFYVILAWLPEILQTRGFSADFSGWMLALSQGAGILGTLAIPIWAERLDDQRRIVWALAVYELVALLGLLHGNATLTPLWVGSIGFVLGGTFGLALLLIVLRTRDTQTATELSGMAQSVGYLLAAVGPALFGFIHDVTNAWAVPMLFLVAVLLGKVFFGLGAGKPTVLSR